MLFTARLAGLGDLVGVGKQVLAPKGNGKAGKVKLNLAQNHIEQAPPAWSLSLLNFLGKQKLPQFFREGRLQPYRKSHANGGIEHDAGIAVLDAEGRLTGLPGARPRSL